MFARIDWNQLLSWYDAIKNSFFLLNNNKFWNKFFIESTEPDHMSAAKNYGTSLHTTLGYLNKFPILNANTENGYSRSKMFKVFGGYNSAIVHNYFAADSFFSWLKLLSFGLFRKTLDHPESCIWYKFKYNKESTKKVWLK